MYRCTKCDKMLTAKDVKGCICSGCGLQFKITKDTDIEQFQEDMLIERFEREVNKKLKRINYYDTVVNMLKAYLSNVVMVRVPKGCTFYRVDNAEVTSILFRVRNTRSCVRMDFDYNPKYQGVVYMNKKDGRYVTTLDTKDFEKVLDVSMSIYKLRSRRTKKTDASENFYRYR